MDVTVVFVIELGLVMKMMNLQKMKIGIVLVVGLILSGCMDFFEEPIPVQPPTVIQDEPESPTQEPTPDLDQFQISSTQDVRVGGALYLSMRAPLTLNPLLNEDATVARVLQLMFEPLITIGDDLWPVPHLASLEFAFNGASVVVTIRSDARWSDGSPVTADDLAFSIDTLRAAPAAAIYKQHVDNFAYYEILNERSLRITFENISGGSAYLFNFPIIPRHLDDNMAPISNGPFMFEFYTPMESLRLVRNPYTFRDRPNINEVYVMITPDAETDRHAFDRGLVDIYLAEVPEWARHHSVKPVRFWEHFTMHYEFIGFNFAREIPKLDYFRRAIAHSIDVESLITDVFLTHAMAARSPIHPASWLYEPDTPLYIYDISIARTLAGQVRRRAFQEDLWPVDYEGETLPLEILVNEKNIEGISIAEAVATQMDVIGLQAEIVALPFEEYIARLQNGYFDLFIGGYNLSLQPDLRFAFHSESRSNLLSYSDPEMDRLLEVASVAGIDSQFYRAMSDIQIYMAEQLPVISLAFRHSAVITGRRVSGEVRPAPDNIFINVEEWFIE